jgi:hypothetical protein
MAEAATTNYRFIVDTPLDRKWRLDLAEMLGQVSGEPANSLLPGGTVTFLFIDIEGSTQQ